MKNNPLHYELIQTKYTHYQEYLRILDDEFLGYEYADRIGNEDGSFEWLMAHKGFGGVIDALEDWCANELYDNPYLKPVNQEYKDICNAKKESI